LVRGHEYSLSQYFENNNNKYTANPLFPPRRFDIMCTSS
jgi:hypothetical protein